jgi:Zn finger protein HypA/HybF involved in hydrogenase expression
MDEMYCSKCGDLLIYKCEHLSTTSNKYIVEPCKNCTDDLLKLIENKNIEIKALKEKLNEADNDYDIVWNLWNDD